MVEPLDHAQHQFRLARLSRPSALRTKRSPTELSPLDATIIMVVLGKVVFGMLE